MVDVSLQEAQDLLRQRAARSFRGWMKVVLGFLAVLFLVTVIRLVIAYLGGELEDFRGEGSYPGAESEFLEVYLGPLLGMVPTALFLSAMLWWRKGQLNKLADAGQRVPADLKSEPGLAMFGPPRKNTATLGLMALEQIARILPLVQHTYTYSLGEKEYGPALTWGYRNEWPQLNDEGKAWLLVDPASPRMRQWLVLRPGEGNVFAPEEMA